LISEDAIRQCGSSGATAKPPRHADGGKLSPVKGA
jgi:hypothetical protein